MIAQAYGNVYVGQIAIGANEQQTIRAMLEAQAWDGPSILIAYSTCIAHGIEMSTSMSHQKEAVSSGYWPLYRFRPSEDEHTEPLHLDSKAPTTPVKDFMMAETRFSMLTRSDPERAKHLMALAQADADERWHYYSQAAGLERSVPSEQADEDDTDEDTTAPAARRRRRRGRAMTEPPTPALATRYLGLELTARSSPRRARSPGGSTDLIRLEDAGAAAVVLPSLFEEEVIAEEMAFFEAHEQGAGMIAEFRSMHARGRRCPTSARSGTSGSSTRPRRGSASPSSPRSTRSTPARGSATRR